MPAVSRGLSISKFCYGGLKLCEKKPNRREYRARAGDTGDPLLNLWAATLKQAIDDARAGDASAAAWLWATDPQVAEIARIPAKLAKAKKKVRRV